MKLLGLDKILPHATRVKIGLSWCILCLLVACAAPTVNFTEKDLTGRWASPQSELVEGATPLYGHWDFTLTDKTWTHTFTAYADPEGTVKLFQYRVGESPYQLGAAIANQDKTRAGDFIVSSRYMTAFVPDFITLFTDSQCGNGTWEIGVEQEVTQTGCAFIPSSVACPAEYDLVRLDGNQLTFGDRAGDMCDTTRPEKLSAHSFVRQ